MIKKMVLFFIAVIFLVSSCRTTYSPVGKKSEYEIEGFYRKKDAQLNWIEPGSTMFFLSFVPIALSVLSFLVSPYGFGSDSKYKISNSLQEFGKVGVFSFGGVGVSLFLSGFLVMSEGAKRKAFAERSMRNRRRKIEESKR